MPHVMAAEMEDSFLTVLETCWQTIETYSDLEATVAAAQTCRSLHHAIIDADSAKIKVSHFEVDNSPSPSLSREYDETTAAKNWHTAPSRIPHYLSHSLNAIHFPSLRRLALDFPATRRPDAAGHAGVIDDACGSAFPILVTNLSFARNLERLYLNAGRLMATERLGHLEGLYEIFARNLCRCRELRDLEVDNSGIVRGHPDPWHSIALTRALIPTLRKKRIERLKVVFAGCPSDPIYARKLSTRGVYPVLDFFRAALSAERLRALEVTLSMSKSTFNFNMLVAAAAVGDGIAKERPSRLTKLRLNYEFDIRHGLPPVDLSPAAPLMDHFSECDSLESVFLNFPAECWKGDENVDALRRLLENKPFLSSVTISFSFFNDESGNAMKGITETLSPNIASKSLCKLSLFGIKAVGEKEMSKFQHSMQASGMVCDKFGSVNSRDGRSDVMIMNNRRLMVGESVGNVKDAYKEYEWMTYQNRMDLVVESEGELTRVAPGRI